MNIKDVDKLTGYFKCSENYLQWLLNKCLKYTGKHHKPGPRKTWHTFQQSSTTGVWLVDLFLKYKLEL